VKLIIKNSFSDEIQAQQRVREESNHQSLYDENEINGKFRITSENWREELKNPESREFKVLLFLPKIYVEN